MSEATKRCPECDETKPKAEFYSGGRSTYCQPCTKIVSWRGRLKREYGLTEDQVARMISAQDGRCRICQTALGETVPNIDHDHETGRVRGVLCDRCNRTIGLFGDDAQRLRQAAAYLRKHYQ